MIKAAIDNPPYNIDEVVENLREVAHDVCLGPSTKAIVQAAKAQNIPWQRLNQGSLVQLGHGCKQRRICTAESDTTSAIAEAIAQDKDLTRKLLRAIGVPTPDGRRLKAQKMLGKPQTT